MTSLPGTETWGGHFLSWIELSGKKKKDNEFSCQKPRVKWVLSLTELSSQLTALVKGCALSLHSINQAWRPTAPIPAPGRGRLGSKSSSAT